MVHRLDIRSYQDSTMNLRVDGSQDEVNLRSTDNLLLIKHRCRNNNLI